MVVCFNLCFVGLFLVVRLNADTVVFFYSRDIGAPSYRNNDNRPVISCFVLLYEYSLFNCLYLKIYFGLVRGVV